jgi:hypothetical protein
VTSYPLLYFVGVGENTGRGVPMSRKKIDEEVGISFPLEEFLGSSMPTYEEVLRHFHHQRHTLKKLISVAALHTARNVLERWTGTIPTNLILRDVAVQNKILKLYNKDYIPLRTKKAAGPMQVNSMIRGTM